MNTDVAIIGGGLSGLYAATLLHDAGVDVSVVEARTRLGGRILSAGEDGEPSEDGFDLGPSWFWPRVQPQLAALVGELGLATFPQHNDGDVIFERMSRETPSRYSTQRQEPQSMRLAGGMGALIRALAMRLPSERVLIGRRVSRMSLAEASVTLTIESPDDARETITAAHVIAAIPPRLLTNIAFTPDIDPATARLWAETATWMAPHAKFFAIYDRPFWREAGLSGTAQSFVGPLGEIHDATTASGRPALFGFFAIGADVRASLGEAAIAQASLQQLARLFGPEAPSRAPPSSRIGRRTPDGVSERSDCRRSSRSCVQGMGRRRVAGEVIPGRERDQRQRGRLSGGCGQRRAACRARGGGKRAQLARPVCALVARDQDR